MLQEDHNHSSCVISIKYYVFVDKVYNSFRLAIFVFESDKIPCVFLEILARLRFLLIKQNFSPERFSYKILLESDLHGQVVTKVA